MEEVQDAGLKVEGIWISPGHDFRGRFGKGRENHGVVALDEVECVAGRGLADDRYFDYKEDFKGQVSFLAAEILEELREKYGEVDPTALRRNVLVRGANLAALVGKKFSIQGLVFEGSEDCEPCFWMDEAVGEGAEEFLKGNCRAGIRARILTDGTLRVIK
ncbi:MAG: MOSC domain-containing protein [Akkermansiaceae bacterium]|nr:MOSC domain-containing protein [Akkermansiaceae bacterium]